MDETLRRAAPSARSPLARRVLASFAVVVVIFGATVAVGLTSQRRSQQDVIALSEGYVPLETALARVQSTQSIVVLRLEGLLDDPRAAGPTREWLQTFERLRPTIFAPTRAAALTNLGEAPDPTTRDFGRAVAVELDEIEHELGETAKGFPDLFGALEGGDPRHARELLNSVTARERNASSRLNDLARRIAERRAAVVTGSNERDKRAILLSLGLALASLVVAALATRDVRRRLSPLGRLTERAQAIAGGDRSPLTRELLQSQEGGPARDEIGELAVAFAAMVDGVASRDADLLRLRQRQEDIVNHLRAAVIALRADGVVEASNPAARALFGVELGQRLASCAPRLWDVVASDVAHAIGKGVEPPARTGITLVAIDTGKQADSAHASLVVDLRVVPMRTTTEGGRLALLVVDDVSDAAAARLRALQAERLAAIGKMAAHITHEIRNPLSSIGLNVELLDETLAQSEAKRSVPEARRLLSAIAREVGRLADVSEDYLRVARLPSPRPSPIDLAELVRDVVVFAGPELERARVVLDLRLPGSPVIVGIDEAQVRQALLNLVRNAREAMEDGGKLTIELTRDRERVVLRVADEGAGIAESLRPRIFDPFFTTKPTGTGLGLPLTKQILEAHGGTISYEPSHPRGSCFVLTFATTTRLSASAIESANGELKGEAGP